MARDIIESVTSPNDGYWHMLVSNAAVDGKPLQDYFEDAIEVMYDPNK